MHMLQQTRVEEQLHHHRVAQGSRQENRSVAIDVILTEAKQKIEERIGATDLSSSRLRAISNQRYIEVKVTNDDRFPHIIRCNTLLTHPTANAKRHRAIKFGLNVPCHITF